MLFTGIRKLLLISVYCVLVMLITINTNLQEYPYNEL